MKAFALGLRLIATLGIGTSAFSQGVISFSNQTSAGDWRVQLPDGAGAGMVSDMIARLFMVEADQQRVLVGSTTFRTIPPAASYFLNPIDLNIPGKAPGIGAEFIATFSSSSRGLYGETPMIPVGTLGGGAFPRAELSSIAGQAITVTTVPEPSALLIVGTGILLLVRFASGRD